MRATDQDAVGRCVACRYITAYSTFCVMRELLLALGSPVRRRCRCGYAKLLIECAQSRNFAAASSHDDHEEWRGKQIARSVLHQKTQFQRATQFSEHHQIITKSCGITIYKTTYIIII